MFRMLIEDPEFRSLELPLSKSQREELEHRILTQLFPVMRVTISVNGIISGSNRLISILRIATM